MSATTYIIAFYIKRILEFIKFPPREETRPTEPGRQKPNFWVLLRARRPKIESLPR